MGIPLKEGLRFNFERIDVFLILARKFIPLKEGLRQYKHVAILALDHPRVGIPVKEGLRRGNNTVKRNLRHHRAGIPLEEGLRLTYFYTLFIYFITLSGHSSRRRIKTMLGSPRA